MDDEFKIMGFRELEEFYKENGYYADQDPRHPMNQYDTDTPERRMERINTILQERKVIDAKSDTGGMLEALPMSREEGMLRKKEIEDEDIKKGISKGTIKEAAKGGSMSKQMELFDEGGLKDEGGTVDPVSGNEVPPGSTQEEVRDDIPAQLSEGEFVFPADVVRYLGLEFLMNLRQKAKAGLKRMEEMGQMGNSDEATLPDDIPFTIDDLEMAEGGVVEAQAGTYVAPSIPIFRQGQDQNMLQQNQVTQANQMQQLKQGPGVRTVGMAQPFKATGKAYAPISYEQFLGPSAGGAPETETQIYKHPDGRIRNIVIIKATGLPLIPGSIDKAKADGFEFQAQPLKDELKVEPVKQTAKLTPVSEEGGESSGTTTSAVDPAGDPLSYGGGTGGRDNLDKTMKSMGMKQLSLLAVNVPNIISGAISGRTADTKGLLSAMTQAFTTAKTAQGNLGKNINTLTGYERAEINAAVRGASVAYTQLSKDEQGKSKSTNQLGKEVNVLAEKYGLSKVNLKNNINLRERVAKKIADIEVEKDRERDEVFSKEVYTDVEKTSRGETVDPSSPVSIDPSTIGTGPTQGPMGLYGEERDQGPADDSPSGGGQSSDSSPGMGGGTSGDTSGYTDDTGLGVAAKGGFFSKSKMTKQKPKPKKMKRGGLASKK